VDLSALRGGVGHVGSAPSWLQALEQIPEARFRLGPHHRLAAMLATVVAAVLCGPAQGH